MNKIHKILGIIDLGDYKGVKVFRDGMIVILQMTKTEFELRQVSGK